MKIPGETVGFVHRTTPFTRFGSGWKTKSETASEDLELDQLRER